MIKARLVINNCIQYGGDIYIVKDSVSHFRSGRDCNHVVVGVGGKEVEIVMSINDFKNKMEE